MQPAGWSARGGHFDHVRRHRHFWTLCGIGRSRLNQANAVNQMRLSFAVMSCDIECTAAGALEWRQEYARGSASVTALPLSC